MPFLFAGCRECTLVAQPGSLRCVSGLYVWPLPMLTGELAIVVSGVAVCQQTSYHIARRVSTGFYGKPLYLLIFGLQAL